MSLKGKERFKCAGTVDNESTKPGAGTTFYQIWTGRSRPRLEVASSCTESEPATSVENFVLRHSGLEREEMSKDISSLSALDFPHSG